MRTKRKKKRTGISLRARLLALFLLFACSGFSYQATPPAVPQDSNGRSATTRSIVGKVVSTAGTGIPGAVVLLKDGKTLQVRSYIAQTGGEYHFFGLSTDVNYTLRAENNGITSKEKSVSVFDSHRQVKLNLKLSKKLQQPKK